VVTLGGVRAAPPEELETSALIAVLADDWGLAVEAVDYAAVGGGSYHWLVKDLEGTRSFVTADDLDQKPWLGETRESAFDGLRCAFDTAVALRDAGIGFVVAPISTSRGETVRRIGPRHAIALFPFVDGEAGTFGTYETAERAALLTMLADLHEATPVAASVARRIDLALPGRDKLEAALQDLNQTWSGGPLSEPARRTLAGRASDLAELLALRDRLSADVAMRSTDWVITHGEPHAGNVMRAGESYVLVDWDTVALAPRERDLWMFVEETAEEATRYTDATGRQLDEVALSLFRLTWDLADIAAFTDLLRSPHDQSEDTEKAHEALIYYVTTRDRWAPLLV
jgi:spectinomycin phosphotransferase